MQRAIRSRAGFTLIEIIVSMAILTIVLGGLTSVLMLVSRAMPQGDRAATELQQSSSLDVLAEELMLALDKPAVIDNELRFNVPDRTGDALPEGVVYTISGSTLTRSQNGAAATPVLGDVASIGVTTGTTSRSRVSDPTSTVAQVLGLWSNTRATSTVHQGAYLMQPFLPPTGSADSMRITRIRLHAAQGAFAFSGDPDNEEWIVVAVHRLDALFRPLNPAIAEVELHPSRLQASASWIDLPVGVSTEIETGGRLGIVIRTDLDSAYGPILSRQTSDSDGGVASSLLFSLNRGGIWFPVLGSFLVCEVEAELITQGATVTDELVWTSTARVEFTDGSARSTSARLLSRGEGP